MLSDNYGAVFRADYDPVAKTFGNPSIIAGNMNDKSFKEGTGGSARFNKPQFGVFVKNEKYGEGIGPDNDQYDFYFCDRENHCIWKLDPHGVALQSDIVIIVIAEILEYTIFLIEGAGYEVTGTFSSSSYVQGIPHIIGVVS